ncbi:MAG: hypothetical protein ACRDJ1_03040 [Actinomycetota bacterium]
MIDIPIGRYGLFEVTEVMIGTEQLYSVEHERTAPFALGRHAEQSIVLRGVLRGCGDYAPGVSVAWDSYKVRYRVLGVTRTTEIRTRSPVIIQVPQDYICTEPSRAPIS